MSADREVRDHSHYLIKLHEYLLADREVWDHSHNQVKLHGILLEIVARN